VKIKLSSRLSDGSTTASSGNVSVIARVYESLGGAGKGELTVSPPSHLKLVGVWKVNLLEDELEELEIEEVDGKFKLNVETTEFEVVSYKFEFGKST
jgi:hypothetical protein